MSSAPIWALDETATPVEKTLLCVMPKGTGPNSGTDYTGLSSFGTDADGEIYFCQMSSIGGRIYKLQRGGPPPPTKSMPKLLSQTGVFTDLANLTPADFLIPYTVNSPLWSDGAVKTRWFALPANTVIGFSANGEWTFPAGTVFVKNFALPVDDTNPQILRRLETRLLVRDTNGYVYGASYKWRADNSDADLVTAGITEDITIKTARRHTHAKMVLSRPAGLSHLPHARVRRRARRQDAPAQRPFQIPERRHRQPASHARPYRDV